MKDPVVKMKWERIFASHISNKGLVSRMYKELLKPNNRNPFNEKMGKTHEGMFYGTG